MLSIWSIVLALGVVQGILMSIVMLTFKGANRAGNRLLAIVLFFFSLLLLEEFLEVSRMYKHYPKVPLSTFTIDVMFGPLIYLYTVTVHSPLDLRKNLWHVLPPVIVSAGYLLFHFGTSTGAFAWVEPEPSGFFIALVNIKIIYLGVYFFMSWKMLSSIQDDLNDQPVNNRIQIKGLTTVLMVMTILTGLVYLLFDLNVLFPGAFPPSDLFTVVLITGSIYMIVFIAIRYPIVFTEVKAIEFYEKKIQHASATASYKTSSLNAQQKEMYVRQLMDLMTTAKPYRNQQIKAEDLAAQLNIPLHHFSQLINEVLEKNFYEFINHYRVQEVKEKMLDPRESHKSLLGIAMDAGFNSKATFNRVFREFTGLTPSAYKSQNDPKR